MQFSSKERTYIMQRFMNFKDQGTRDKIMKIAGLMAMDADEAAQADMMYAAVAYYMKNTDKIEEDLKSYMLAGFPDISEGQERPTESGVRNRKNRRKGES